MDAEKLTTRSREALSGAVRRAAVEGHSEVGPLHLLAALLGARDGVPGPLLSAVGADPMAVLEAAESGLRGLPRVSGSTVAAPGLDRAVAGRAGGRRAARRLRSATSTSRPSTC